MLVIMVKPSHNLKLHATFHITLRILQTKASIKTNTMQDTSANDTSCQLFGKQANLLCKYSANILVFNFLTQIVSS